jgi:oligopeptidase A
VSADLKPNFEPDNIVENISKAINIGMTHSALASNGVDWESVVDVLDEAEHLKRDER